MVYFDLYRGDSFPVSLTLTSSSTAGDVAMNLTGYSATLSLRWLDNTVNLNSSSSELTIGSTAGTIDGTFTATTTLPDALNVYLVLNSPSSTRQTYDIGRVRVLSCASSDDNCDDF